MSRLFTELYIDEDVSAIDEAAAFARVCRCFGARSRNVGCSDKELLAHALSQRKALLTHNRVHFEALVQQYYAPAALIAA